MQPKKAVIDNFRAHEEDYGKASVEFATAYVHLQCAITNADAFYSIFKKFGIDMGEVKQGYNRLMTDMEHLADSINKHFGMDTKVLLGKVYDDAQAEIDKEIYSDNEQ